MPRIEILDAFRDEERSLAGVTRTPRARSLLSRRWPVCRVACASVATRARLHRHAARRMALFDPAGQGRCEVQAASRASGFIASDAR